MNGLITSFIAGTYKITDLDSKSVISSKVRGNLKVKGIIPKVGDFCSYHIEDGNLAIIDSVNKRKNDLIRPNIANIDQAFVIFSVKEPDLNLNLLDKFLVTLEFYNILPIIVFTKFDLVKKDEMDNINNIINYYSSIGYKTIITKDKRCNIEDFKSLLENKISVFTGQSGVGKSTLINFINPSLLLETQEISKALGRGKHTTRHVELYPLYNGYLADTPGFGTLEFTEFSPTDISTNFVEFFKSEDKCFYHPCLHMKEPKCRVKELVDSGEILKSRYENYISFVEESINKDKRR